MTPIPVANPGAAYRARKAEIDAAVRRALDSGWYIMGPEVDAFEREFAAFVGSARCVSVGNGTDAIELILRGLGIGPGDAVVTVAHTAVATVTAIDLVGARPLLVDVDPVDFTMDPGHLERTLAAWSGPPVRAIIPVHLYGRPADMDAILGIAARHGIPVIEDCAQAHGATFGGRNVGTLGVAASFSFYPTKNLGALGDGGASVTSDPDLDARMRLLKQYGWKQRYISDIPGLNTRLDEVQAAILRAKLPHLTGDNARRRAIAAALRGNGRVEHPRDAEGHVYHQYVVRSAERDALAAHLHAHGVGTAILYPVPVHLQPGYADRVSLGPGGLPATERAAREILSLPVWPELEAGQVETIAQALRGF